MSIKDLYNNVIKNKKDEADKIEAKTEELSEKMKADAKARKEEEQKQQEILLKELESFNAIIKPNLVLLKTVAKIEFYCIENKRNFEDNKKLIRLLKTCHSLTYKLEETLHVLSSMAGSQKFYQLIKALPENNVSKKEIDILLKPYTKQLPAIIKKNNFEGEALLAFENANSKCLGMESQLPSTLIKNLKYYSEPKFEYQINVNYQDLYNYARLLNEYADFHNAFLKDRQETPINQAALAVLMQFEDFMVSRSFNFTSPEKKYSRLMPIVADIFKNSTQIMNEPQNLEHAVNLSAANKKYQNEFTKYKFLSVEYATLRETVAWINLLAYITLLLVSFILPITIPYSAPYIALITGLALMTLFRLECGIFFKDRSLITDNVLVKQSKLNALEKACNLNTAHPNTNLIDISRERAGIIMGKICQFFKPSSVPGIPAESKTTLRRFST